MMMTPRKTRERVALNGRHDTITAAHEDHAELIQVARIRTDGGTQMRTGLNQEAVNDYADAYASEAKMPPLEVTRDAEGNIWLWDGFHRLAAWRLAHERINESVPPMRCNVQNGDRRDAVLKAAGANQAHGLRRTNEDKWRSVELLLQDDEWRQWSDREIAAKCGVSAPFVGKVRRTVNGLQSDVRRTADGRTMNTTNIGKRAPTPTEIRAQQEPQPEPVQPGIVATAHDALDHIERQEAYERAQRQPEPPAPQPEPAPPPSPAERAARIPAVARKAARLHNVAEVCELLIDHLDDYQDGTGDYDGSREVRKWMRHMQQTIQRHLNAYEGRSGA